MNATGSAQYDDILGLKPPGALHNRKFHPLAFLQLPVAFTANGAEMDVHVRAAAPAYQPAALHGVECLHDALFAFLHNGAAIRKDNSRTPQAKDALSLECAESSYFEGDVPPRCLRRAGGPKPTKKGVGLCEAELDATTI